MVSLVTSLGNCCTGVFHFQFTMIKDAIATASVVLLVVLSSSGIFNSCLCHSAVFTRKEDAYIGLNSDEQRRTMSRGIYPELAFGTILLQGAVWVLVLLFYRKSTRVFYRTEKELSGEYREEIMEEKRDKRQDEARVEDGNSGQQVQSLETSIHGGNGRQQPDEEPHPESHGGVIQD